MNIFFLILLCTATLAEASNPTPALILSKKFNDETQTLLTEHREIFGEELTSNESIQELRNKNEQGRSYTAAFNSEAKKLHAEYHAIVGEKYPSPTKTAAEILSFRNRLARAPRTRDIVRGRYQRCFYQSAPDEFSTKVLSAVIRTLGNKLIRVTPAFGPALELNSRFLCYVASKSRTTTLTSWSPQLIETAHEDIRKLATLRTNLKMERQHLPAYFRPPLLKIMTGAVTCEMFMGNLANLIRDTMMRAALQQNPAPPSPTHPTE